MTPELSVVVPVMNEVDNAVPLLNEICAALRGKIAFEVLFVDDASKDGTVEALLDARKQTPELRVLKHAKNSGQSRAVRTGVLAARGKLIATLDGDGQNDPADIPKLFAEWAKASVGGEPLGVVAGQRLKRQDSAIKRWSSRIANSVRQWLLDDGTRDTGCGLKLFSREAFLALPYFDHLHRYHTGLDVARGLQDCACRRASPAARARGFQIRHFGPAFGGLFRSQGRTVAETAVAQSRTRRRTIRRPRRCSIG